MSVPGLTLSNSIPCILFPPCVDARKQIRLERASKEEKAIKEDKKLADEIERIKEEQRSIKEAMHKAENGYKDAITKENRKLQTVTKQRTEVAARLQEAQKTAAAAAAKAIVAQKQVKGKSLAGIRCFGPCSIF